MQFVRQHAKVWDFTSRHACLEVKFGFRQVQVCFIGGSLPVILSSMVYARVIPHYVPGPGGGVWGFQLTSALLFDHPLKVKLQFFLFLIKLRP